MKSYTICEYQSFTREIELHNDNFKSLEKDTFDKLKQFILEGNTCGETDALDLMGISFKKGIGDIITAKNYVGLISFHDGTVIEVLPKVAKLGVDDSKELLIDMLKTVKELPFKTFNTAKLHIDKMPLLEVFISMFINEVKILLQKGLKSDYVLHQENEKFLKGKLLFHNHIKENLTHKERFYVEYHLYNLDRPENRLIKATLEYLFKASNFAKNKKDLQMILLSFDEVSISKNIDVDFALCSIGRDMRAYEQVLQWCKIFLKGNSFSNTKGSNLATALLFPMERLFESYVAEKLRKALDLKMYNLKVQDSKHHLFEKKFALRPDIVVENKVIKACVVMDTKWKLLNVYSNNYGISQSDMYQMYAYGKKYKSEKVVLLYPLNDAVASLGKRIDFPPSAEDKVSVSVRFLDLSNKDFIEGVLNEFCS